MPSFRDTTCRPRLRCTRNSVDEGEGQMSLVKRGRGGGRDVPEHFTEARTRAVTKVSRRTEGRLSEMTSKLAPVHSDAVMVKTTTSDDDV